MRTGGEKWAELQEGRDDGGGLMSFTSHLFTWKNYVYTKRAAQSSFSTSVFKTPDEEEEMFCYVTTWKALQTAAATTHFFFFLRM